MKCTHLATGALFVALGVSGRAVAVTQLHAHAQAAVNNCQGALPSFEGALRKRPLGIANEGGSPAFISCALSATTSFVGITFVVAAFVNRGAAAADVSCTLVEGLAAPFGTSRFSPQTLTVFAHDSRTIGWSPADNGGNNFTTPNISCALPPGVEIDFTETQYFADVGN